MSFGVLKMKWQMLKEVPSYAPHIQSQIIVACCAQHNFIRVSGIGDRHFARCDRDKNYVSAKAFADQPETIPLSGSSDSELMNAFRESIAIGLLIEHDLVVCLRRLCNYNFFV
jgi:hypothetical protein